MGKFKGIVYLSEEQYLEKYNAKTLDEDTQYVTDQEQSYSQSEVDEKLKELENKIPTEISGEYTKVTVDGVYQETFNADTKANTDDIPTKTSQLENDSNFVTSEDLDNIQVGIPVRNFIEV